MRSRCDEATGANAVASSREQSNPGGCMRMTDCRGKRIRGVGARCAGQRKKARDHRLHLQLLGTPSADDRLLHLPRGVLGHR